MKTFGSLSTNGQTPFWISGNQYGIVPVEANTGYLQAGIFHRQPLGYGWEWRAGLDMVACTPRYRKVYAQQIFVALAYRWINLSAGSRSGYDYNLSLTNPALSSGDMVLSTNARPIPEINLYVPQFVTIPGTGGWLQGRGNFAAGRSYDTDYLHSFVHTDQPYIQNMLWHHKSLYLRVKDARNDFPVSMTLGIRHVAQWGGVSTDPTADVRVQPHSFKDFIRIVFGESGNEQATLSDQINVLGSHYGSYDFRIGYEKEKAAIFAYYQHFFDDASGMELRNIGDGLRGIQINLPDFNYLDKIVLERIVTVNQSGPFHFIEFDHTKYPGYGGGGDDYYNNGEYTSGHAYFNRSLGSPFLISPEYNADGSAGFKHSRIRAWHLGTEGNLTEALSYRLLASTIESFGTPYAPTLKKLTNSSFTTDLHYLFRNSWIFSASLAADRGSLLGNHIGFSLSVVKRGLIR
ncbi:MAG: capsule assembly Wzi family protein [Tannerella sp.]|nr:capsule assembly Wzi family protein [Tannerella sp.]